MPVTICGAQHYNSKTRFNELNDRTMYYNVTTTPNFEALRVFLASSPSVTYTTVDSNKENSFEKRHMMTCASGKECFYSAIEARKASQTVGSPYRDRRFFRCDICGHYHFSGKEMEQSRPSVLNRSSNNIFMNKLVLLYRANPKEMGII